MNLTLPKNWKMTRNAVLEIAFVTTLSVLALLYITEKTGIQKLLGETTPAPTTEIPPPGPPMPAVPASSQNRQPFEEKLYEDMKKYANKVVIRYPKSPDTLCKEVVYVIPQRYDTLLFYFNDYLMEKANKVQVSFKIGPNTKTIPIFMRRRLSLPCYSTLKRGAHRFDLGRLINFPVYFGYPDDHPNFIQYVSVTVSWKRQGTELHGPERRKILMAIVPSSSSNVEVVEMDT